MKLRYALLAFSGLVLSACGDSAPSNEPCSTDEQCNGDRICEGGVCTNPEGDGAGGDEAGGAGTGGGDVSTPGGPEFLSFGSDVSILNKTDVSSNPSVTFTVVLTDPDGVEDLIGGSLLDESGPPFGSFATSGQEGSYQLSVTWDQINLVAPVDFDAMGARSFRAQFFDQDGHVAEKTLSISLSCNGASACAGDCGSARCSSECVYLGSDENCAGCADDCGFGYCGTTGGGEEDYCYPESGDCVCIGGSSTEDTNALCSDDIDNDGDGYTDCIDFNCSQNPQVTVCD